MEYTLHDFKIHGVDGDAHAKFSIETSEGRIEYDEPLSIYNKDDVMLLQAIDEFVRKRVK